jgi:hypothetical protein
VARTSVSPVGPYNVQAGSITTFYVLARDKWGNPVPMVGVPPMSASVDGPFTVPVALNEDPNFLGNYVAQFNVTLSGTYHLHITTFAGALVIDQSIVNVLPGEHRLTIKASRHSINSCGLFKSISLLDTDQIMSAESWQTAELGLPSSTAYTETDSRTINFGLAAS